MQLEGLKNSVPIMVTELMNRCCHVIRRIEVSYILSEGTAAGLGELFSAHSF